MGTKIHRDKMQSIMGYEQWGKLCSALDGGLSGTWAKCPSCGKNWGSHLGNMCNKGQGPTKWPLENVLLLIRKNTDLPVNLDLITKFIKTGTQT